MLRTKRYRCLVSNRYTAKYVGNSCTGTRRKQKNKLLRNTGVVHVYRLVYQLYFNNEHKILPV